MAHDINLLINDTLRTLQTLKASKRYEYLVEVVLNEKKLNSKLIFTDRRPNPRRLHHLILREVFKYFVVSLSNLRKAYQLMLNIPHLLSEVLLIC